MTSLAAVLQKYQRNAQLAKNNRAGTLHEVLEDLRWLAYLELRSFVFLSTSLVKRQVHLFLLAAFAMQASGAVKPPRWNSELLM